MSINITSNTKTKKDHALDSNQDNQIAISSAISDQLFIEMCDRGPMIDDLGKLSQITGLATRQINWYYLEAALYAARISVGDFSASKAERPRFKLKMNHFSPALQRHLRNSIESLNEIITDAAFTLFRARHALAFYKYIEPERKKFRWSLA